MKVPWISFIAFLSSVILQIPASLGFMNLFLNRDETFRLLGLPTNLYYIREGEVNSYALSFQIPVAPNISMLHFTWQSLVQTPIPYSISMSLDDVNALRAPAINISREGIVPVKEEVFRIVLPCASSINAEVDVNIYFNLTLPGSVVNPNVTSLILKRKKICLMDTFDPVGNFLPTVSPPMNGEDKDISSSSSEEAVKERDTVPFTSSSSLSLIFMATGCALIFVFLLSVLLIMCYIKSNKSNIAMERTSFTDCSSFKEVPLHHPHHYYSIGSNLHSTVDRNHTLRSSGSTRKLTASRSLTRLDANYNAYTGLSNPYPVFDGVCIHYGVI